MSYLIQKRQFLGQSNAIQVIKWYVWATTIFKPRMGKFI